MNVYFKQSIGCFYKNLRDVDYKAYSYYDKGETLVANHPSCTYDQIKQGLMIEVIAIAVVSAVIVGISTRGSRNKLVILKGIFLSTILTLLAVPVINVIIMAFPFISIVAAALAAIGTIIWTFSNITNPLTVWRNYQQNKERKAQNVLNETQAEINRLRASDPDLDKALKSLDAITTSMYDD